MIYKHNFLNYLQYINIMITGRKVQTKEKIVKLWI